MSEPKTKFQVGDLIVRNGNVGPKEPVKITKIEVCTSCPVSHQILNWDGGSCDAGWVKAVCDKCKKNEIEPGSHWPCSACFGKNGEKIIVDERQPKYKTGDKLVLDVPPTRPEWCHTYHYDEYVKSNGGEFTVKQGAQWVHHEKQYNYWTEPKLAYVVPEAFLKPSNKVASKPVFKPGDLVFYTDNTNIQKTVRRIVEPHSASNPNNPSWTLSGYKGSEGAFDYQLVPATMAKGDKVKLVLPPERPAWMDSINTSWWSDIKKCEGQEFTLVCSFPCRDRSWGPRWIEFAWSLNGGPGVIPESFLQPVKYMLPAEKPAPKNLADEKIPEFVRLNTPTLRPSWLANSNQDGWWSWLQEKNGRIFKVSSRSLGDPCNRYFPFSHSYALPIEYCVATTDVPEQEAENLRGDVKMLKKQRDEALAEIATMKANMDAVCTQRDGLKADLIRVEKERDNLKALRDAAVKECDEVRKTFGKYQSDCIERHKADDERRFAVEKERDEARKSWSGAVEEWRGRVEKIALERDQLKEEIADLKRPVEDHRIFNDDFAECLACSKKPGSPTLCRVCLHNRKLVDNLQTGHGTLKEQLRVQTDRSAGLAEQLKESFEIRAKLQAERDDTHELNKRICGTNEELLKQLEAATKALNKSDNDYNKQHDRFMKFAQDHAWSMPLKAVVGFVIAALCAGWLACTAVLHRKGDCSATEVESRELPFKINMPIHKR